MFKSVCYAMCFVMSLSCVAPAFAAQDDDLPAMDLAELDKVFVTYGTFKKFQEHEISAAVADRLVKLDEAYKQFVRLYNNYSLEKGLNATKPDRLIKHLGLWTSDINDLSRNMEDITGKMLAPYSPAQNKELTELALTRMNIKALVAFCNTGLAVYYAYRTFKYNQQVCKQEAIDARRRRNEAGGANVPQNVQINEATANVSELTMREHYRKEPVQHHKFVMVAAALYLFNSAAETMGVRVAVKNQANSKKQPKNEIRVNYPVKETGVIKANVILDALVPINKASNNSELQSAVVEFKKAIDNLYQKVGDALYFADAFNLLANARIFENPNPKIDKAVADAWKEAGVGTVKQLEAKLEGLGFTANSTKVVKQKVENTFDAQCVITVKPREDDIFTNLTGWNLTVEQKGLSEADANSIKVCDNVTIHDAFLTSLN